jgi:hypothetical protein
MTMKVLFTVAILVAHQARADAPAIRAVKTKETVDLLAGLSLIYKGPHKVGFSLRVFVYEADGECPEDVACTKDKLFVVASTFDEYPEKRAFEVPIVGAYKRIAVPSVPKKESGNFLVRLYTESINGKESCVSYVVSLREMRAVDEPCPP